MSLSSSRHVMALSIWYSMTQTASYTTGTRSFWTLSDCWWVLPHAGHIQYNTKSEVLHPMSNIYMLWSFTAWPWPSLRGWSGRDPRKISIASRQGEEDRMWETESDAHHIHDLIQHLWVFTHFSFSNTTEFNK